MTENWKAIPGYEGRYEVSDLGRVKSLSRVETYNRVLNNKRRGNVTRAKCEKFLVQSDAGNGYLSVRLRGKTFFVHVLVLTAFVGPRPHGLVCCHGDGNKLNNYLTNLRWDTYAANNAERFKHGMKPVPKDSSGRFIKREKAACA